MQQNLGGLLKLQDKDLPTLRIVFPAGPHKPDLDQFTYEGDLESMTVRDLENFVIDIIDKKENVKEEL